MNINDINNCPFCKSKPLICDYSGIGWVYCPCCKNACFHFSDKAQANKRKAIRKWNKYANDIRSRVTHKVVFYENNRMIHAINNVSHVAYDVNRLLIFILDTKELLWLRRDEYDTFQIK